LRILGSQGDDGEVDVFALQTAGSKSGDPDVFSVLCTGYEGLQVDMDSSTVAKAVTKARLACSRRATVQGALRNAYIVVSELASCPTVPAVSRAPREEGPCVQSRRDLEIGEPERREEGYNRKPFLSEQKRRFYDRFGALRV
jgi:hypothetical protein